MKVCVVEDSEDCIRELRQYLTQFGKDSGIIPEITVYQNGLNFVDEYRGDADLILMDIAMPHMDGLEAARRLRQRDRNVCLIFVTTLSNYAIRGYEVDALDFLVKPISYELFRLKMEKALFYMEKNTPSVYVIQTAAGIQKIRFHEIIFVETEKHYLLFHTEREVFKMRGSIRDIRNEFLQKGFAFTNGSVLVNLHHVDAVRKNEIQVGEYILPLARIYKADFMKKLTTAIGGGIQE